MKDISELQFPETVRYAADHEWARPDGDSVVIGITDYAQDQLGDIVYVELPKIGEMFATGEVFGTVESVKAVSELFMPVGGEVIAINSALMDSPDQVNADPYHDGWMIRIVPAQISDMNLLMDQTAYITMLKG
ncbi:MAG: glycine cleavage system protein GcvH [Desulfatirhabdiaceae bacterium]